MFCIQEITNGVFKGYVQGAGGPNLYIGLYVFKAKNVCIYMEMLK
jgi:hypothetical protein